MNYKDNKQRMPGMPCPNCKNLIPITMHQLLEAKSIFCPICGLKLSIDKKPSDKAKDVLRKIEEAQKKLENK
jgi:rRNA maturation endonuclease Nob1